MEFNWKIPFNPTTNGQLNSVLKYVEEHSVCQSKHISEGLEKPYRTIVKQVDELVHRGMIIREGSKKTGGYVLTQKGRDYLGL